MSRSQVVSIFWLTIIPLLVMILALLCIFCPPIFIVMVGSGIFLLAFFTFELAYEAFQ